MGYDHEYMRWFLPHTRHWITKETSYWDTLVESQVRMSKKCEPSDEIHIECIKSLRAVKELDRLTLDDARAKANSSAPAAGCGRQEEVGVEAVNVESVSGVAVEGVEAVAGVHLADSILPSMTTL